MDSTVQDDGRTRLLSVLGFVEKTQAQIDELTEPDRAASALSKAAEYFAHVLAAEPDNISALNGMANVYAIRKDYDRACKLGETLFTMAPEYGAAIFDYALALEGLMEERGEDTQLLEKLDKVYRHLQTLIRRPEQNFSAGTRKLRGNACPCTRVAAVELKDQQACSRKSSYAKEFFKMGEVY